MSKIIIKIFLRNVAKQPCFFGSCHFSEFVECQQTNIVLRMARVEIIRLIPPIHLNPFPEETLPTG